MNAEESLSEQHRVWEDWAQADPLWAILSDPNRKGGKWDLAEFFSTGEEDIGKVLAELAARGLTPATKRGLDFGCGVGRLTQAMARTFDRCDGVDLSETSSSRLLSCSTTLPQTRITISGSSADYCRPAESRSLT